MPRVRAPANSLQNPSVDGDVTDFLPGRRRRAGGGVVVIQLKTVLSIYNAAFDYNDDGVVSALDNFAFKESIPLDFVDRNIVYTI